LKLMRVDNAGSATLQTLWQWSDSARDGDYLHLFPWQTTATAGIVAPDWVGGVLAQWTSVDAAAETTHLSRVAGEGVSDHIGLYLGTTTANGTAYLWDDIGLSAFDVASWTKKWTYPDGGYATIPLDNGHLVVNEVTALTELDETGTVVSSSPVSGYLD